MRYFHIGGLCLADLPCDIFIVRSILTGRVHARARLEGDEGVLKKWHDKESWALCTSRFTRQLSLYTRFFCL
jgi:hypothetical protein